MSLSSGAKIVVSKSGSFVRFASPVMATSRQISGNKIWVVVDVAAKVIEPLLSRQSTDASTLVLRAVFIRIVSCDGPAYTTSSTTAWSGSMNASSCAPLTIRTYLHPPKATAGSEIEGQPPWQWCCDGLLEAPCDSSESIVSRSGALGESAAIHAEHDRATLTHPPPAPL